VIFLVKLKGNSVFGGIAIGKIKKYKKKNRKVKRYHIDNVNNELKRFNECKKKTEVILDSLYKKALKEVGEVNAMIFDVHKMLLEDLDFIESIENIIKNQEVNSEFAIAVSSDNFSELFASMEDEYIKERAADIKDVSERLISVLQDIEEEKIEINEPYIMVADDLSPSETVQLDKSKILAFVTRYGSVNSHTAILARTMNIPALVGIDIPDDIDNKQGIVDGFKGMFYIEPTDELHSTMDKIRIDEIKKKDLLKELKGKETITQSGKKINLYANIGNVEDVLSVMQNDGEGIGLFRSEFLYLEKSSYPSEEDQFKSYKKVAESMAGKKVIIRTLDIGADKQIEYFNLDKEENPAMGYRAIRICLDREEIFKTQLRAIFRASAFGNLSIMYPMIISTDEIHKIKEIVKEVKCELKEQDIDFKDIEEGVMIETPAAVMISDLLAKEVDFFSIGTNDLTQYTLAIDRQNSKLDKIFNPHHLSLLRMIKLVITNAHKEGKWVGICGELASDFELTETFLEMGIDELSVSPTFILPLRKKINDIK
jgi:phosphotransferase system enzyme I (PtsI)